MPPPFQCQAWHPRQTAKYVTVLWGGKLSGVEMAEVQRPRAGPSGRDFFHTGNAFQRTGTHSQRTCVGVRSHVHMAVGRLVPGGRGLVAWSQRFGVVAGAARGWWHPPCPWSLYFRRRRIESGPT